MTSLSLTLCLLPALVTGHGSLVEPPSRATMHDLGFPSNPKDNNWMEGFCGGKGHQWSSEIGGRCGVCGDAWDAEIRDHEAPDGRFANGIIVREYQPGQVIPVTTHITANHVGFVDFRLCSNNNVHQDPGQECFEEMKLNLTSAGEGSYITEADPTKLWIEDVGPGLFEATVQLPEVECSQCILQWTYWNGRDWGTCNGACGPVETFRACADIAIGTSATTEPSQDTTTDASTDEATEATTAETTDGVEPGRCVATGAWAGQEAMDDWCEMNCHHSYQPLCPPEMCSCEGKKRVARHCVGVGVWRDSSAVADWCVSNCFRENSFCPASMCDCY